MAILKIRTYPDPLLRSKAEGVTDFGAEMQVLFEDMIHTMFEADGVGLAAPQVGISKRIVAVTPAAKKGGGMVMINPVIKDGSGSEISQEGCLSFPGLYSDIVRFKKIHLEFQDRQGCLQTMELMDFFARVVQHEMDHLDGILMIDRLEFNKRQELMAQYEKTASKPKSSMPVF